MEIRSAETGDLERVQELSVELSEKEAEEFDSTIDPEWNTTEEATEYFRSRIRDGFAQVVETEDSIVGYMVGGIASSEAYREDLKLAEIESMYITPEHRGRGIGTEFVETFESWAEKHNADRIRVEVTSQNGRGLRFYEDQGLQDYARTLEKDIS